MTPFALALSDIPNRPDTDDTSDADDASDFAPRSEIEPEIEPGVPDRPDVSDPTAPPAPEITPPAQPEIEPPAQPEIEPPTQPEIVPPDQPEITPPSAPEIRPPPTSDPSPDSAWVPAAPPSRATPRTAPPAPVSPAAPPEPKRPPLQRAVLAVLLIAAAGLIGYVLSTTNERPDEPDALARSVEAAGNLRLLLRTDVPAEARQFVREEFGWRVGVPTFEAASLTGVAIAQAAAAVEVPVFLYADEEDRNVAVFAYSYALLDQVPDRLRLTDDDYDDLAEGAPVIRGTDLGDVILWRDRDDIYVAVTDLPPDALTDGLSMDR